MNKTDTLRYITYLVTSARGCINEPKIYGSFRLIDSATKFFETLRKNNLIDDQEISEIIALIEEKKYSCMFDEKEFIAMLDHVVDKLVDLTMEST